MEWNKVLDVLVTLKEILEVAIILTAELSKSSSNNIAKSHPFVYQVI